MNLFSILTAALMVCCATAGVEGQVQSTGGIQHSFGDVGTPSHDPQGCGPAGCQQMPPFIAAPILESLQPQTVDQWSPLFATGVQQDGVQPANRETPTNISQIFYGYDAWRGVSDGAWTNNGLHVGLNHGTGLGGKGRGNGIGFQIGGSVGVYDWAGTDYRVSNNDQATTQGFVTYGFFRRADEYSNLSWGVVHDWMINNNYSVMGEDMTLNQVRTQISYTLDAANEVGVWGAWRGGGDTRIVPGFGPVTWQPHNQLNFFWHHKWNESLTDTKIWFGIPERKRLTGGGTLGDWIAGLSSSSPITDRAAIYTMVNYMHQSATAGWRGSREDAWNFHIGLSIHPGRSARSRTVNGHKYEPLFRVANNGLFLVDASQTY